ncbi:MAG: ABC transporter permease [Chloroflexi bacterium]|nr:ABC transporter permease [Chloroflexota bacterium]
MAHIRILILRAISKLRAKYPISIRRFISVLTKEYRHILREPRMLWMVFLSPAFVLITLSGIFTSGSGRVSLVMWDQDHTPLSRQFVSTLSSDDDFALDHVSGYEQIESSLVNQRADAAMIIPPGFADTVWGGKSASVQVILDGVDRSTAGQATGMLLAHTADFGMSLSRQYALPPLPLQIRSQSTYLPDNAERDSMLPGIIPIVFSLPVMAAALALARERETGSLESLVVTPVRGIEYLGGKLIAYVTTALVGLLPVWLVATLLFGVPFRGSPLLLILLTTDFLLASMGMALFIGSLARSQQTVTVVALFVFFVPGFFLTGLIDPIDTTDLVGTAFSYMFPGTHFVIICRAIFLKGANLFEVWRPALRLLLLSIAWMMLGMLTFRKQID